MEYAVCYVSTKTNIISEQEIEELLPVWEKENNQNQIKGLLLYSDGNFFQMLEGEKILILALIEKIKKDPRHKDFIQIIGKDLRQGSFDNYISDYLNGEKKMKSDILSKYLEAVKGMETRTQNTIKGILEAFIDTRVI